MTTGTWSFLLQKFLNKAEKLSLVLLGVSDFLLVTIGYIFLRWKEMITLDLSKTLRGCLIFCATLSVMSPVLRTLTKTFAEDTIWALAISLTIIHLLSHDYTFAGSDAGSIDGTISLNAAIFTSVLLASRLQTNEHVFTLILLAVEMFALFPIFQQKVKVYSDKADITITITLCVIACIMTWYISKLLCFTSILVTLFLTFICPLWFMHVQEFKNYEEDFSKPKCLDKLN